MKSHFKHIKKLGLAIMGFEGSENIYNTLNELKDIIDYTVVGIQEVSYHGDPIRQPDLDIINSVQTEGLIDNICWITTDLNKEPRAQEADKRNILMQDMESHGCTHTIVIDADEYYNRDSFLSALQTIDDNNYDLTYCQYANYYKDYNTFLIYPFEEGMFVPFVSRAHYRFTFNGTDFDKPSDPTRRFVRIKNNGKYIDSMYIFAWKELKMHHLSWCRISCSAKLTAWSSKKLFNNHNNLIDRAIYDFEHYEETQPDSVHIIFNVPGNLVKAKRINHAFISPERDINYYRHYYYTLKKAIVLNMSTTYSNGLYTRLEQCCRETWAGPILNNEYQNISYWSVTDTESDSYIDNDSHTVYIKNKAEGIETSFETLTHKFIQAIKMLQDTGVTFDYIIKTNTSTWLNIPYINTLLTRQVNDHLAFGFSLQCAFWSRFNVYLKGNLTIFPKRIIDYLIETKLDTIIAQGICDDVLIGSTIAARLTALDIPQIDRLRVMPCVNMFEFDVPDPIEYCAIQVKTYGNREQDIVKMKRVHKQFQKSYKNNDYSEACDEITNTLPMKVQLLPYTKAEWLGMKQKDKDEICKDIEFQSFESWNDMWDKIHSLKVKGGYA